MTEYSDFRRQRTRLEEIVIKQNKLFGNWYESGEWEIPCDLVYEYDIFFREMIIGKFWVSNTFENSIQLYIPLDLEILYYILEEIKARKFEKNP
jgi:hypothetical protein